MNVWAEEWTIFLANDLKEFNSSTPKLQRTTSFFKSFLNFLWVKIRKQQFISKVHTFGCSLSTVWFVVAEKSLSNRLFCQTLECLSRKCFTCASSYQQAVFLLFLSETLPFDREPGKNTKPKLGSVLKSSNKWFIFTRFASYFPPRLLIRPLTGCFCIFMAFFGLKNTRKIKWKKYIFLLNQ